MQMANEEIHVRFAIGFLPFYKQRNNSAQQNRETVNRSETDIRIDIDINRVSAFIITFVSLTGAACYSTNINASRSLPHSSSMLKFDLR